jgi:hypothetical protein
MSCGCTWVPHTLPNRRSCRRVHTILFSSVPLAWCSIPIRRSLDELVMLPEDPGLPVPVGPPWRRTHYCLRCGLLP